MSKDTPEVGDVWEFKYGLDRVYILKTQLICGDGKELIRVLRKVDESYFVQREHYANIFREDYRYFGKSIAKIDDLFKTENEK